MLDLATTTKAQVGYLAMIGGFLTLVDSLWGIVAAFVLDWSRVSGVVVGISIMLAMPAYLVDFRSKRRIVIFLPTLILCRWLAVTYVRMPPTWSRSWQGIVLPLAALIFLQLSKLGKSTPSPSAPSVHAL